MKLDDRLQAIAERCGKATEGPWVNRPHGVIQTQDSSITIPREGIIFWDDDGKMNNSKGIPNYDFIAKSRTDIPLLLSLVKELRGALEQIAEPAPDGEVPDEDAENAAEAWFTIATRRKKLAREALARAEGMAGE